MLVIALFYPKYRVVCQREKLESKLKCWEHHCLLRGVISKAWLIPGRAVFLLQEFALTSLGAGTNS